MINLIIEFIKRYLFRVPKLDAKSKALLKEHEEHTLKMDAFIAKIRAEGKQLHPVDALNEGLRREHIAKVKAKYWINAIT